jgi:hypothetical protein
VDQQEWLDDGTELMTFAHQQVNLVSELETNGSSEQQAIFFDHAANLILNISSNANETGPRNKHGSDPLAFFALDLHLAIPADPPQFSQPPSIILVALIHAYRQSRVRMSRVNANNRKVNAPQFMRTLSCHER